MMNIAGWSEEKKQKRIEAIEEEIENWMSMERFKHGKKVPGFLADEIELRVWQEVEVDTYYSMEVEQRNRWNFPND